ncbi:LANO_0A00958g1_1 [Lachancea nothofagi CBS 11611]|uniref:LANO_0A00958g1_1 n=1 Tax=Lachancea nothofagi CBS 11611 TaxID=1266666 RepID=A0A1G4IM92_9SACH|nr:LANO_0A00958g1_1 [Lachancea nothofagi CBS 11611]
MSLSDEVPDSAEDPYYMEGGVKKRRKAIKQCLFCRKRKLKCDKKKPMCTTCVSRGLTECVYVEQFGPDLTSSELFKTTPNLELLNKIKELEEELRNLKEGGPNQGKGINPLPKVQIVMNKGDRTIFYGCTSLKVNLSESRLKYDTYYAMVWRKIKEERRRWKATSGYSTLKEVTAIELVPEIGLSVLDAMCRTLPSYERIEQILHQFFEDTLSAGFQVVDPTSVFKNLKKCFITGPKDMITGTHPIAHLAPGFKKNYYSIGVITEIITLVRYNVPISQAMDCFNKFLLSSVTAKVFFIERVQYIFLRRLYMMVKGLTGGDHSNTALITNLLSSTALHVGLHGDIKKLFATGETSHGEPTFHENLWLWILYADIETSTALGMPPKIPDAFINYELIESESYGSVPLLQKIIRPMRQILNEIHEKDKLPDLDAMTERVRGILRAEFRPISFYMDRDKLKTVLFTELDLLLELVTLLSVFSNLKRSYFKDYRPSAVNNSLQYSIQSVAISISATEAYFDLDKTDACKPKRPLTKGIPYNLNLAVFLIHKHFPRNISEIYVLLGSLGTWDTFEEVRFKYPLSPTFDLPMGSLDSVSDHYVSFQQVYEFVTGVIDRWESEDNADMVRCLKRFSYGFVIVCAIERSSRDLFSHYFNKRKLSCTASKSSPFASSDVARAENDFMSTDQTGAELSDDILKTMADEFWSNYDTDMNGWLVDNDEELYSTWFKPAENNLRDYESNANLDSI